MVKDKGLDSCIDLSQRILELRLNRGLCQKSLAASVGFDHNSAPGRDRT
jgi:hypothetical protein